MSTTLTPDVVIVGAGPAGLTAAARIAPRLGGQVLVLDRERAPGGIPRHSNHPGFGIRDLHRFLTGPAYARALAARATDAGAQIRTEAMVTGWAGETVLEVTTPQGRLHIDARAVVLATGTRERPRPARLIPGDRPSGIYTTGQLQHLVHLHHGSPGRRAVVVGAEPVSWSAALTLRTAGCRTALMTTRHPAPESPASLTLPGRVLLRVPVATRTRIARINGRRRLTSVETEHLDTGERRTVECDTLVLTGEWTPEQELARSAGLDLAPGSRSPLTDTALRTSRPGVFAAGNVLHPADTADAAAMDGRHVAEQVLHWLTDTPRRWTAPAPAIPLLAEPSFRWVFPGLLHPGDPPPPGSRLLLWPHTHIRRPRLSIHQGDRLLAQRALPRPASPGRVLRVPWEVLKDVDPQGGSVRIGTGSAPVYR